MKIAYIYTALTTFGGVDRVLTVKANYLAEKMGYDVTIITESQTGRPPVFPLSPKVKHIDLETDFDEEYHYSGLKRYMVYRRLMKQYRERMEKTLTEIRPDIVCTTCGRDLDFLCKLKDGSKKVGESHITKQFVRNFHLMEQRGFPYNIVARYWRHKQENAVRQLDGFVVLTKNDAESWADIRRSTVIPNPLILNVEKCASLENHEVISVGRLEEQKGFDLLLPAWAKVVEKHPDWCLTIYGEGSQRGMLQTMVEKFGIGKSVRLPGQTDDVATHYLESSIYALSSRFEGFGLVLTEAMSFGIPCVAFNCPYGPSDIIADGEDGLLVENGNTDALAEGICRLIENKGLRRQLGQNAKLNIQRYAIENVMPQWDKLFTSLVK